MTPETETQCKIKEEKHETTANGVKKIDMMCRKEDPEKGKNRERDKSV